MQIRMEKSSIIYICFFPQPFTTLAIFSLRNGEVDKFEFLQKSLIACNFVDIDSN